MLTCSTKDIDKQMSTIFSRNGNLKLDNLTTGIYNLQSTPLNRVTSGPGCFDPIKWRNRLTENIASQTVILSYKSCEILTRLSDETD